MTAAVLDEPAHLAGERQAAARALLGESAPGEDASTFLAKLRSSVVTTDQLKELPPPEYLIEGVLVRGAIAELWSRPGSWKSFVVAGWSCHLATGTPWAGHHVERSRVLYVVAEGAIGMGERISAWEEHHGIEVGDALTWLPMAVQLAAPHWADALAALALELDADLIVIDTRSRCTVGVEENSAKEMGLVVHNLERIRQSAGCGLLLVHHADGTGSKSRGSTSVLGALETELKISRDGASGTLELTKQKNGPDGLSWKLSAKNVGASIVVEATSNGPATSTDTAAMRDLAEALQDMYSGDAIATGVLLAATGYDDKRRRTGERALRDLMALRLVDKPAKGRWAPTDRLAEWLEARQLLTGGEA